MYFLCHIYSFFLDLKLLKQLLNSLLPKFQEKLLTFFSIIGGYPIIVGQFENHLYDNGGKNSSHYATITYNNVSETYTWKNEAGANWTLYPTAKLNELKVGPDCPHYRDGHTVAKFTTYGVYGPGNELYTRKCKTMSTIRFSEAVARSCSVKKMLLNVSQNGQENIRPQICSFIKKRLWQSCFPLNFPKVLRTPFSQNTSGSCFQVFSFRGVFTTVSNIYYGVSLPKQLTIIEKSSIIDVSSTKFQFQ